MFNMRNITVQRKAIFRVKLALSCTWLHLKRAPPQIHLRLGIPVGIEYGHDVYVCGVDHPLHPPVRGVVVQEVLGQVQQYLAA